MPTKRQESLPVAEAAQNWLKPTMRRPALPVPSVGVIGRRVTTEEHRFRIRSRHHEAQVRESRTPRRRRSDRQREWLPTPEGPSLQLGMGACHLCWGGVGAMAERAGRPPLRVPSVGPGRLGPTNTRFGLSHFPKSCTYMLLPNNIYITKHIVSIVCTT